MESPVAARSVQGENSAQAVGNGSPASRKATIIAASLFMQVVANVIQICIGFVCMRNQLARDLAKVQPEAARKVES